MLEITGNSAMIQGCMMAKYFMNLLPTVKWRDHLAAALIYEYGFKTQQKHTTEISNKMSHKHFL